MFVRCMEASGPYLGESVMGGSTAHVQAIRNSLKTTKECIKNRYVTDLNQIEHEIQFTTYNVWIFPVPFPLLMSVISIIVAESRISVVVSYINLSTLAGVAINFNIGTLSWTPIKIVAALLLWRQRNLVAHYNNIIIPFSKNVTLR